MKTNAFMAGMIIFTFLITGCNSNSKYVHSSRYIITKWEAEGSKCSYFEPPIAFNPEGKLLLAKNAASGIEIWDVQAQQCVSTLKAYDGTYLTFSPDCTLLAGFFDNDLMVWNIAQDKQIATFWDKRAWRLLGFSPDSKMLIILMEKEVEDKIFAAKFMKFWDAQTKKMVREVELGSISSITGFTIDISSDGKFLAAAGFGRGDPQLGVWDMTNGQCIAQAYLRTNTMLAPQNVK